MELNTFSFFIGFVSGFGSFAILMAVWFNRVIKRNRQLPPTPRERFEENKKQAEDFVKDHSKEEMMDVVKKMRQVETITKMQQELMGQIQSPSKNSMHSRHKNSLGSKVKELEQEKYDILSSVVDSGYDPVIVAIDPSTGEPTETRLSDYLDTIRTSSDIIEDNPAERRRSALRLVKGDAEDEFNRDDDDENTTIH